MDRQGKKTRKGRHGRHPLAAEVFRLMDERGEFSADDPEWDAAIAETQTEPEPPRHWAVRCWRWMQATA